jgi:hypothetical protein
VETGQILVEGFDMTHDERIESRLNDERYRWLRRRNELTEADDPRGPFVIELLDDDTIHHMTGEEIDAAIDAARLEGKP